MSPTPHLPGLSWEEKIMSDKQTVTMEYNGRTLTGLHKLFWVIVIAVPWVFGVIKIWELILL
jgi:hypothetical protein